MSLTHFSFPGLKSPGILHGVFSRHGGISVGNFCSLNVSYHVGDQVSHVKANRALIKQTFAIDRLISARQVHGADVLVIEAKPDVDFEPAGYDALISRVPGVALMIQQADCQAVLLFDPVQRAVGIVHAGWRGSVANIIGRTIKAMTGKFTSRPADLKAAISSSLGPCCAEFINHRTELPADFAPFQVRPAYFDFWAVSRAQLLAAGLQAANIEVAEICTVCNPDYFSYRREGITGRFASIIGLD